MGLLANIRMAGKALALAVVLFASVANATCVEQAVNALGEIHVRVRSLPVVEVDPALRTLGSYSRGVVKVRDEAACVVVLHELVHHWQWERWGDAKDMGEWTQREMQAEQMTRQVQREMQ